MKKRNVGAQFAADSLHRQSMKKGPSWPFFVYLMGVMDEKPQVR